MPPQHAGLTEESWRRFSRDQQLLMIANELNRASKAMDLGDCSGFSLCYERVLRLADLTAAVASGSSFRRELLRWRELAADLYRAQALDSRRHGEIFRALLGFSPATWAQRPYVTGAGSGPSRA
jgi:hypothetical protein